jgi:hypothetical protein
MRDNVEDTLRRFDVEAHPVEQFRAAGEEHGGRRGSRGDRLSVLPARP